MRKVRSRLQFRYVCEPASIDQPVHRLVLKRQRLPDSAQI
jgi:hypothetical protein